MTVQLQSPMMLYLLTVFFAISCSYCAAFSSKFLSQAGVQPSDIQPGSLTPISFNRPEGAREFWLYAPKQYDPSQPWPLAFYFHSFGGDYTQGIDLNMTMDADNFGYLMIFGRGTLSTTGYLSWNGGICCNFPNSTSKIVDDVAFTRTAFRLARAAVNVDPSRVFAMGWSNGAFMSERLGCEAADIFTAIVSDAGEVGIEPGGLAGLDKCDQSFGLNHMSYLHFHGTADPIVKWTGSGSLDGAVVSTLNDVARWTNRLDCTNSITQTYNDGEASNMVWNVCRSGSMVELMTIRNGLHMWWTQDIGGFPTTSYSFEFFNMISNKQKAKQVADKTLIHPPSSGDWRDYHQDPRFVQTMKAAIE